MRALNIKVWGGRVGGLYRIRARHTDGWRRARETDLPAGPRQQPRWPAALAYAQSCRNLPSKMEVLEAAGRRTAAEDAVHDRGFER